jgi:deazaflavin-dependent oxidoreductase (nitroreductase family)
MGLLTPVAVKVGGLPWLPRFLPQIVWVDKLIQRLSRGRLTLLRIAGLPNLMLTVAGRKSGIARSTPLLCVPYGGRFLVAGSNFGGPKPPLWVANLEAARECTIRVDGRTQRATARLLEGEERQRAWQHMLRTWPNFAKYEKRTERTIKVFLLTPHQKVEPERSD